MLLNTADKVYFGANAAAKVYRGSTLVWEPEAAGEAWGPNESLYPATAAAEGTAGATLSLGSRIGILSNGRITHIRYWRASGMVPSRTVAIWSDAGALLFSKVSTGVAGWNNEPVDPPLAVSAGAIIRVAYGFAGSPDGNFGFTNSPVYADTAHLDFISGCYTPAGVTNFPDTIPVDSNYYADIVYQEKIAAVTGPTAHLCTSFTPGADRDDFTGEVGVRINTETSREYTWLGMLIHPSNSGVHLVKVYEWFSGSVIASANFDVTGKTPGTWMWVSIPPFTPAADGYIAILKTTTAGSGQPWFNEGVTTFKTPDTGDIYATYKMPGGALSVSGPGAQYVGVDLGW